MRNSIRNIFAVVLILLGIVTYRHDRPRTLTECFPEGIWESCSSREIQMDMTPEQLKGELADIIVFRRGKFSGFDCASVSVHIRVEGVTYLAEIGEDGSIAIARQDDRDKTYWQDVDGEAFRLLTGQQGT